MESQSQATPSGSELPQGLSVFPLGNGLTLLIRESHENPTISLSGSVTGGSLLDAEGKRGTATMVANLLRRGTKERSWQEIESELEDRGMSLEFSGGRENASFAGRCLSEDAQRLLTLLAELLRRPSFPSEQVELVRKAVAQDILRSENDTFERAYYAGRDLLYGAGHPYAGRTAGSQESVASITRDNLIAYHAQAYRPANTILVAVGDVEPQSLREEVEKLFGDWQGEAAPIDELVTTSQSPQPLSEKRVEIPMPDKSNATVVAMRPGLSRKSPDYYAALTANYIFGGDMLARLNQKLRVREGLTYGAYSFMNAGIGEGPWCLVVQVAPGEVNGAEEMLLTEWESFACAGITEEELARGKSFLTGNFPVRLHTPMALAGILTDIAFYELPYELIEKFPAVINALTLDEVNATIHKHFAKENYALLAAGSLG